jgi:hypothetical protein
MNAEKRKELFYSNHIFLVLALSFRFLNWVFSEASVTSVAKFYRIPSFVLRIWN